MKRSLSLADTPHMFVSDWHLQRRNNLPINNSSNTCNPVMVSARAHFIDLW